MTIDWSKTQFMFGGKRIDPNPLTAEPEPEPPAERQRRMYSCGYYAGQWCAPNRASLDRYRNERAETARESPGDWMYFIGLGLAAYYYGFEDGWHGRVPKFELRIADLAAYDQRVGARR